MSKITGSCTVRVDGQEILKDIGGTLNVGGKEREAQMGPRGVNGYRESPVAPTVEIPCQHDADTDLVALGAITDATVLFATDTGQTYMLRRAFTTEPPALNTADGTFTLNMSGVLERL
ncbi:MAG: phage tail tube protein [Aquisalimonadaceae bacterium]